MKIIQKDVHVFYENETYHRREKIFGTVSNIRWFFGTSYIRLELEEKLEAEYQKTLIPTKTLNLSEEKGSITNLVKQFCKEKQYYDDGKDVLEQFAKWVKANGEKPEVVNPVGQTIYTISEIWETFEEIITKQGNDVMLKTALAMLPRHIKFNRINSKPRETDKEEPKQWKLQCKEKDSHRQEENCIRTFNGSKQEVIDYVNDINSRNFSYKIVDFSEL